MPSLQLQGHRGGKVSAYWSTAMIADMPEHQRVQLLGIARQRVGIKLASCFGLVQGCLLLAMWSNNGRPTVGIAGMAMLAAGIMTFVTVLRQGTLKRRCTLALEWNRCGARGYSLAAVTPEADGCRVCPECGAAWRRPAK